MNFIKSFLKKRLGQETFSTRFKQVILIPDAILATVQSKHPLANTFQCQPKTYTPEEIETIRQTIAKVLKQEGFLLFEGECLRNYAETLDNSKIRGTHGWQFVKRLKSSQVREITTMANSDFPLTLCYPGKYRDASNWFIPNLSCIFSWLEGTGLEMISYLLIEDLDSQPFSVQRIRAVARKSQNSPPEEHPVFPKNWQNLQ